MDADVGVGDTLDVAAVARADAVARAAAAAARAVAAAARAAGCRREPAAAQGTATLC